MSIKGFHVIMKNKKALKELMDLGKQYDNEQDPVKKEALKKEIEERCAVLKGKFTTAHAAIAAEETPETDATEQNHVVPEENSEFSS